MKIIRTVNGRPMHFELSDDELYRAYAEQRHLFDMMDVESYTDDNHTKEEIELIAREMRHLMDKYGCTVEYAVPEAIRILVQRGEICVHESE